MLNNSMKKFLSVGCLTVLLTALLVNPVSAYGNGSAAIRNKSGTTLGYVQMWNNNEDGLGKEMYAQTTADEAHNNMAAHALFKGMRSWNEVFYSSDIETNDHAKSSPIAELLVPNNVTPVDARCIGAIESYVVGLCKSYNFGQGKEPCSDGEACDFPIDLLND